MLLLGRGGRGATLDLEGFVRLQRRGQLGGALALGLEIALGQIAGGVRAGQLVDQLLTPQPRWRARSRVAVSALPAVAWRSRAAVAVAAAAVAASAAPLGLRLGGR